MALSSKKTSPAKTGKIRAVIGAAFVVAPVVTNAQAVGGAMLANGWHPALAATCAVLAWVVPLVVGATLVASAVRPYYMGK